MESADQINEYHPTRATRRDFRQANAGIRCVCSAFRSLPQKYAVAVKRGLCAFHADPQRRNSDVWAEGKIAATLCLAKSNPVPPPRTVREERAEELGQIYGHCRAVLHLAGKGVTWESQFTANRAAKLRKWAESHFRDAPRASETMGTAKHAAMEKLRMISWKFCRG